MKQKIIKIINMRYLPAALLALITVLQLVNITFYIDKKQGYHSDEILSYGLSNSFFSPFIDTKYAYFGGSDELQNVNEWVSGNVMHNYITVQKGEQFRYDSVWYNQSMDRHPPLYYAVMHTICSFFPDTFSPVFGYLINFICFALTEFFLYLLSRNILKSRYLALLVCMMWGFSSGAVNLTIYIRMYSMLAMWTVILYWLHSELIRTKDECPGKKLVAIMLVTAAGFLTQHMFVVPAFIIAVCFCIRYLFKKRFKMFFAYGFSMLGGVILSIVVFPASISHFLFEGDYADSVDFIKQVYLGIKYYFGEIFPIDGIVLIFLLKTIPTLLAAIVLFAIPVMFLFRDKPMVRNWIAGIKNGFVGFPGRAAKSIKNADIKQKIKCLPKYILNCNPMTFISAIAVLAITMITAYTISFMSMGYVDRYLFIVFPLFAVIISSLIRFILSGFKHGKLLTAIIIIGVTTLNIVTGGCSYLFERNNTTEDLSVLTKDSDCIVVVGDKSQAWIFDTFANEITDADKLFLTFTAEKDGCVEEIEKLSPDKPVYLIYKQLETGFDGEAIKLKYADLENNKYIYLTDEEFKKDFLEVYKDLSFSDRFEKIGEYTVYTYTYDIYRLK